MRSPAAATIASTVSCFVMSPATRITASPSSARTSSRRSALMSTAITRPPSRATRDAVARPMPDAAPVTTTVLPPNRPGVITSRQPVCSASARATPPLACSTRPSMTSCGIFPWLSATSCCSGRPRTGASLSSSTPAWARSPRTSAPPTGWSNHWAMVLWAVSVMASDMVWFLFFRRSRQRRRFGAALEVASLVAAIESCGIPSIERSVSFICTGPPRSNGSAQSCGLAARIRASVCGQMRVVVRRAMFVIVV